MKRVLPLALALLAGLIAPARAEDNTPKTAAQPVVTGPAEGTPVVVVGPITSTPRGVKGVGSEKKMQVGIGPEKTDYTLHLRHADLVGLYGQKLKEEDFHSGEWVRAEGRIMKDARRVQVSRLQVIARDTAGMRNSVFARQGYDAGYVTATAGSRETFPAVADPRSRYSTGALTLIGRVTDDTGKFENTRRIRVQVAGNEWTVRVPEDAAVLNAGNEKISVHEVRKGQWVRVSGWQTDDLRMRAARVENIGSEEAYQHSAFYQKDWPLGYLDTEARTQANYPAYSLSGKVVSVNNYFGYFTVRDDQGTERRIYREDADLTRGGRSLNWEEIHEGDRVKVTDRNVEFEESK
jgi:hypothetical protein